MKKCIFCSNEIGIGASFKQLDDENEAMIACSKCATSFSDDWSHLIGEKCTSPIYSSGIVDIGEVGTIVSIPLTEDNWYSNKSELLVELMFERGLTFIRGALIE